MTDTVEVYTANTRFDAESLVLLLSSFNIPAMINQESAGAAYGFTGVPLGVVRILVPVEFEQDALAVLAAMEQGDLETPPAPSNQDDTDLPEIDSLS